MNWTIKLQVAIINQLIVSIANNWKDFTVPLLMHPSPPGLRVTLRKHGKFSPGPRPEEKSPPGKFMSRKTREEDQALKIVKIRIRFDSLDPSRWAECQPARPSPPRRIFHLRAIILTRPLNTDLAYIDSPRSSSLLPPPSRYLPRFAWTHAKAIQKGTRQHRIGTS